MEQNNKKIDLEKPNLKYREEYDLQVYEHLIRGYTISSFQVKPAVTQTTIFQWIKDHPGFELAVSRGRAEFLQRLETALLHIAFGIPLTDKQKEWMPKVNLKALTLILTRRYRLEYGRDFDPKKYTEGDVQKVTSITFVELPGRVPTKKDPLTGAPIKPDVITEAIEVKSSDE